MLFAVRYTAGRFTGTRMVNAPDLEGAIHKVRTRLREEVPTECAKGESFRVLLPQEPIDAEVSV
jgi:hypothetical protein